jgi:hypothetical protein
MYKDPDGQLYTREELDAAPGNLLTEYVSECPVCGGRNKTPLHFRDTMLSSRICEGRCT